MAGNKTVQATKVSGTVKPNEQTLDLIEAALEKLLPPGVRLMAMTFRVEGAYGMDMAKSATVLRASQRAEELHGQLARLGKVSFLASPGRVLPDELIPEEPDSEEIGDGTDTAALAQPKPAAA
jgi:hypothetical protein